MTVSREELLQLDRQYLIHSHHSQHRRVSAQDMVVFTRGEGVTLFDDRGTPYLDAYSGMGCTNIGHGRPEVARAAAEQFATLDFASAFAGFTHAPAIRLGSRVVELARRSYSEMSGVFLTTSGAAANEAALKTASCYWRNQGKPSKCKVISLTYGYHGMTIATGNVTGMPALQGMYPPLPGFVHVPPPHVYRWQEKAYGGKGGDVGREAAARVEEALVNAGPETVAAIMIEPVMGVAGMLPLPASYVQQIHRICDRQDVLLIADEVFTGFGRTGTWFGLESSGIQPDIVTFCKGVANGCFPLGGMIVSRRVHDTLNDANTCPFTHSETYSCHPVGCALALAILAIVEQEHLVEQVADNGEYLLESLRTLKSLPNVGDVRGLGYMCGIELVNYFDTKDPAIGLAPLVLKEARDRGLLLRMRAGTREPLPIGDVLCMAPPFITTRQHIDEIVAILDASIRAAAAR